MALTTEQIDAEAFARWGEMKGAPMDYPVKSMFAGGVNPWLL